MTNGAPRLLFLPDGGDQAAPVGRRPPSLLPGPGAQPLRACPPEMVSVGGRFCIDRWEAHLVDDVSGAKLSPFYAPSRRKAQRELSVWTRKRGSVGPARARAMAVPQPPKFQLEGDVTARAVSAAAAIPSGYLTAEDADRACRTAGKRLCRETEWVTACRGEVPQKFPYGDEYEWGKCNVFREAHPAHQLHGDASRGHLDPRLNQVRFKGKPLLRPTGATASCRSVWGDDAIYDMVGNLDEWVDDKEGVFLDGFYARSTKAGCDQRISSHPANYYDYSLGVRCCKDL